MTESQAADQLVTFLVERWASQPVAWLRPVFPLLAAGEAVSPQRLASIIGASPTEVTRVLAASLAALDRDGNVRELFGLTLDPTVHRIEAGGRVVYACCALVAHVLPRLLGMPVTIESVDPITRTIVRLDLAANGEIEASPQTACATLVAGGTDPGTTAVAKVVCSHVHHFRDRAAAEEFARGDRCRHVIGLDTLRSVAARIHAAVWDVEVPRQS